MSGQDEQRLWDEAQIDLIAVLLGVAATERVACADAWLNRQAPQSITREAGSEIVYAAHTMTPEKFEAFIVARLRGLEENRGFYESLGQC